MDEVVEERGDGRGVIPTEIIHLKASINRPCGRRPKHFRDC